MVFERSIKQFLRTPITTALFIVLFTVAAFLICTGTAIWARNRSAIKEYEDAFITVATVRQRATAIEMSEQWDAFEQNYRRWNTPVYSSIIPLDVLDFDNANYILQPEKRPFYGALATDMQLWPVHMDLHVHYEYVVEITPLEDFLPNTPGEVQIDKILCEVPKDSLDPPVVGSTIRLCDHYNDSPQMLYADKKYLLQIEAKGPHGVSGGYEYYPENVTFTTQHGIDGTPLESMITPSLITEITDGFYDTDEGLLWLSYAKTMHRVYETIPVLPTNGTQLLMPFYNNSAYILEGEDISPEEYSSGERVCLISKSFSELNGISVGDTLRLPLYCADYTKAPADSFEEQINPGPGYNIAFGWKMESQLTATGEEYTIFSDHEYVIKGIYVSALGTDANIAMGANTVVIPATSVIEDDSNNIVSYGPMTDTTTSFQIPNGSIEAYLKKWSALGVDDLEITFHDKGYTQLQRGLENMKRISLLLLAIGIALALTLVFFFCYIFISKNKQRTAIERMLGYTKKQSTVSLLSGFLITAAIAITIGCTIGVFTEKYIADNAMSKEYFSSSFTIGPLDAEAIEMEFGASSVLFAPIIGVMLLLLTGIIAIVFTVRNTKEEPLQLLSRSDE